MKDYIRDITAILWADRLCNWRSETMGGYILDDFPTWDPRNLTKFLCRKDVILLETDSD